MRQHQTPHWHRGIHAVHFGFLSGLIAMTFLGSLTFAVLSPLWLKQADAAASNFTASSFWNSTIPSFTALHPDSAALVSSIAQQAGTYGSAFVKNAGASPVYIAEQGASTVNVVPWDCGTGVPPGLAAQWQNVPIPFFAVPSGGSNAQMVVYQPSSGTVWEFGHMRNISGQWQACTGGRTSTSTDGVFAAPYGVSASGLAVLGGQLSIQELQAGQINHAIGLSLPEVNGQTWPATQTNGATPGAPPMGLRLRLDPGLNVNSLGLSPVGTAIARAAQIHGFVVWNKAGSVSITGENPVSMTTRGLGDPYGAILAGGGLSGFPWDKLQALPTEYGQSADVPAITQFSASKTSVKADSRVTLTWQASSVNRCAIPGIGDNLPASGSTESLPLKTSTTFILRCGGPAGTASSQVNITVSAVTSNDPEPQLPPGVIIDVPYSGYANILSELMSPEAAEQVYKVVYYEQEMYLFETAKPPFALNTSRMDNGKHNVDARIYYRDGRTEKKSVGITINNGPETLFATQSTLIKAPPSIPPLWGILGLLTVISVMFASTWWGWHKAHLV